MILPGRLLVVLSAFAVGCTGAVVDLGDARPAPYRFGTPRLLVELDAGFGNENPTLTADLRELYFNSNHGTETEADLYVARRASVADPFAAPMPVAALNTLAHEANPAISSRRPLALLRVGSSQRRRRHRHLAHQPRDPDGVLVRPREPRR